MNNIDKISLTILKKMAQQEAKKPTLAIVYDSILSIYPKLQTQNKDKYNCYRKIIIEEITNFYDTKIKNEKEYIKIILSKMLQECNSL